MVSEELKMMLITAYERFKYLGDDPNASPEVIEQLATLEVLAYGSEGVRKK